MAWWSLDYNKYGGKCFSRCAEINDFGCLPEVSENVNLSLQEARAAWKFSSKPYFSRSRVKFNGAKHSPLIRHSSGPFGQKWGIWESAWYWRQMLLRGLQLDRALAIESFIMLEGIMKLQLLHLRRKVIDKMCCSSWFCLSHWGSWKCGFSGPQGILNMEMWIWARASWAWALTTRPSFTCCVVQ